MVPQSTMSSRGPKNALLWHCIPFTKLMIQLVQVDDTKPRVIRSPIKRLGILLLYVHSCGWASSWLTVSGTMSKAASHSKAFRHPIPVAPEWPTETPQTLLLAWAVLKGHSRPDPHRNKRQLSCGALSLLGDSGSTKMHSLAAERNYRQ